jgi:hypothetical protein
MAASCLALLAGFLATWPAHAATKTWDGSSSGFWGTAANWAGTVVPANGDDLVFPANASRFTLTNNIANLALSSITLSGSNYLLRGNVITLTNVITANQSSGTNTIEFPLRSAPPRLSSVPISAPLL